MKNRCIFGCAALLLGFGAVVWFRGSYYDSRCSWFLWHEVGTAVQLYAVDHDDRLPLDDWAFATPGLTSETRCWSVADKGPGSGYALNTAVVGKRMSDLPKGTIVLFETEAVGASVVANLQAMARERHKGGSFVFRASGDSDLVGKDEPIR